MKKQMNINALDLLKALIRFPSISTREKELVDWLEETVRNTGLLETERYGDNLIFHLGSGRPWLLLNTHSDVVPPASQHVGDPFEPAEKKGRIYGRGSTDAKASLSAMLTALLTLAQSGYRPPGGRVSLAVTVCEEGAGFNNGMAFLRTIIDRPDAAIIGEPTRLHPCAAQKGLLILELVTKGEAGHAARVTGKNAIYEMASQLEKLKKLSFSKKNRFIGETRITPAVIQGGTAKNAHPDRCSVFLDIRTIPEVPNERILSKLNEILDLEIVVYSDRFVSTAADLQHPLSLVVRQASGKPFYGSPTTSDWVFLSDVPAIKIGPGDSRDSHTANESVEISQIEKAVELYQKIIRAYFEKVS